ncbi:transcriptional initiation protein Tat [Halogeometricum sp. S1BR25-6]|uniref:Transcriptional initiation protein Tat n=1 Tax=Halogeometricum salsisoli TaxID=2950536 RepID=A0ABU2GDQ2_9EURY|nr:transcriptional initiation protein Tat [Halogeometricum sp. S1BR25-6]MDS0298917.1 transcriptional initiation protein Tat [Halogeometricum sp. S1BR25-6]
MEPPRASTRRSLLGALLVGLSSGCLGSPPSATGPRRPPAPPEGQPRDTPAQPDLYVSTFDYEATDGGNLRVFGEVGNRGGVERVATVRVRVRMSDETYTQDRSVTVSAGGTAEFSTTFEVSAEAFERAGGLDVTLV